MLIHGYESNLRKGRITHQPAGHTEVNKEADWKFIVKDVHDRS